MFYSLQNIALRSRPYGFFVSFWEEIGLLFVFYLAIKIFSILIGFYIMMKFLWDRGCWVQNMCFLFYFRRILTLQGGDFFNGKQRFCEESSLWEE